MEENTIQKEHGLELDFDFLKPQQKTVTSLADLYGYSVFTEEFEGRITGYQKRIKEERDYYLTCVLTRLPSNEIEIVFQKVFEADTAIVIKADYENQDAGQMRFLSMAMFTLLGAVLAGGIWMVIGRKRKGRKLRENNYNSN